MNPKLEQSGTRGKRSISVILPCAGQGRRLGASGPKELHEAEPGIPLIQYSLELLVRTPFELAAQSQVVLVIGPGKEHIVARVERLLAQTPIHVEAVPVDSKFREWPGSIYSARALFSDFNLFLLPDSFLVLSPDERCGWLRNQSRISLLEGMMDALKNHTLVFGAKRTRNERELREFGALQLEDSGTVNALQDKPGETRGFNAIWGCIGFRREIGQALHQLLMRSLEHPVGSGFAHQSVCFPAGSLDVCDYFDLGTPQRIERFLEFRNPAP